MKGILLEFIEGTPFWESTVLIKCSSWVEFEEKLFDQFDSDCYYMQIDCLDSANHNYDAELRVGGSYYKCNNIVIMQEV